MEITGTSGTVVVEGDSIVRVDLRTPSAALVAEAPADTAGANSPAIADAAAHRRVTEDSARSISTGAAPCCDGREGRRSLALVETIYRAARLPAVDGPRG